MHEDYIPHNQLRVDIFTPGGVRVTHVPTGIVAVVKDTEEPSFFRARTQAVEQIKQRLIERRLVALENPPCCEGGPQWGHAMDCHSLP